MKSNLNLNPLKQQTKQTLKQQVKLQLKSENNHQHQFLKQQIKYQVKIQNYSVKIQKQQPIKQKRSKKKVPPWTKNQSVLYLRFIARNREIFQQKKIDQMVFQAMAKFIEGESKGTIQCYNYHNRMKSRYKTIENIIKELQEQHGLTQEEIKNEEQRMIEFKVNAIRDFQKQIIAKTLKLRRPDYPSKEFSSETKVIKTQFNLKFSL